MSEIIIISLNILVSIFAILILFFLFKITNKTKGELKKSLLFISFGILSIVIEHFIIAWLRRSKFPIDSGLWFLPLPLYIISLVVILIGALKMERIFSKIGVKK